jgi:hypothetical protein
VAGPVDAATLLREARWVVEAWKMTGLLAIRDDQVRLQAFFRKAHSERLSQGIPNINPRWLTADARLPADLATLLDQPGLGAQDRIHLLLTVFPLVPVEEVYQVIFEKVLAEEVSTSPVIEARPQAEGARRRTGESVNAFEGYPLQWPTVLRDRVFQADRARLEMLLGQAVQQAARGPLNAGLRTQLRQAVDRLEQRLCYVAQSLGGRAHWSERQYTEARQFLRQLRQASQDGRQFAVGR